MSVLLWEQELLSGLDQHLTVQIATTTSCYSITFFSLAKGDYGSCNNGDIVGQSLSVEGNNYTSQLNVTVISDTAGRTIECLHNAYDGLTATLIFISVIPTIGM